LQENVPTFQFIENKFDKTKDFKININNEEIAFDLKVTRYPNSAQSDLDDQKLAIWFYNNQSKQGRFHLANRFFVVGSPEMSLYDFDLAYRTVKRFSISMENYMWNLVHKNGFECKAIVLNQTSFD
jgi:hypothetical protein